MMHKEDVVRRTELLEKVWTCTSTGEQRGGRACREPPPQAPRALRRLIKTVRGVGFRLNGSDCPPRRLTNDRCSPCAARSPCGSASRCSCAVRDRVVGVLCAHRILRQELDRARGRCAPRVGGARRATISRAAVHRGAGPLRKRSTASCGAGSERAAIGATWPSPGSAVRCGGARGSVRHERAWATQAWRGSVPLRLPECRPRPPGDRG